MIDFVKANPDKNSEMILLCDLIKESINDMYGELLKPQAIKYAFDFITPQLKKREIKENSCQFYFIVKKNKKITGFIEFSNENKDILTLEKMYILKEFRNSGIGHASISKIIENAKNKQYQKIKLYINQNFSNICDIFKKWGFKNICPMARYIGSDFYLYEFCFEYGL